MRNQFRSIIDLSQNAADDYLGEAQRLFVTAADPDMGSGEAASVHLSLIGPLSEVRGYAYLSTDEVDDLIEALMFWKAAN